jgi:tetratricopeptide (TPR) repeat protein
VYIMNQNKSFAEGQMSETETDLFLSELLQRKFDTEQKNAWAGKLEEQGVLRHSDPEMRMPIRRSIWQTWGRMAAAVAFLLCAVIGLYYYQMEPAYVRVAHDLLQQDKLAYGDFRKGETDAQSERMKAADAYQRGDYASALRHWQTLKTQKEFSSDDQFFLAMTLLYLGDAKAAVQAFDEHTRMMPAGGRFEQEGLYYQSLALIKTGELETAKGKLQDLAATTTSAYLKRQAEKMLVVLP